MRKRKERRKTDAGVSHERWLVSYADFMTLLFAFFVVLYASAQMDNRKIVRVAAAIKGAFQELGVFTGSGPVIPTDKIVYLHGDGENTPQFSAVVP